MEAAHTILVITTFFEAVGSIDLPFSSQDLRMSKEEQAKPARRSGIDLSRGLPRPSPYLPFEQAERAVFEFYETYGHRLRPFVMGLEVWDGLGPSEREKVVAQLERKLPEPAVRRSPGRRRRRRRHPVGRRSRHGPGAACHAARPAGRLGRADARWALQADGRGGRAVLVRRRQNSTCTCRRSGRSRWITFSGDGHRTRCDICGRPARTDGSRLHSG
ncbi:hypothetical protein ACFPOI_49805 [Nonomuraea angiospora]|uniref:NACHT N-terminal helical domain 7-containing protein n=1 Tax=Nonomuraea angiospora TaxID=46172 RepID=UPI003608B321